ncbi:hypothetical protein WAF17_11795 [Bernardetia sp. ABR2-2B]|uniref:hypothetical protein n=1 Tax=Bernardetia sp. ABR2-2B TaxID=3127472 RepID=UPI0030CC538E
MDNQKLNNKLLRLALSLFIIFPVGGLFLYSVHNKKEYMEKYGLFVTPDCILLEEWNERELKGEFVALIKKNSHRKYGHTIQLSNAKKISLSTYKYPSVVNLGDTLYKNENSLLLTVKRKNKVDTTINLRKIFYCEDFD